MGSLSEYMRFQYLDPEEREHFILDGFNRILDTSKQLPFQKKLYEDIYKILSVDEIQTIPVITKRMIRETQDKWYSDDYMQLIQTSGTSGYSMSIPFCQHMFQRVNNTQVFIAEMMGAIGQELYLFGTGPALKLFTMTTQKAVKPKTAQLPLELSRLPKLFKEVQPKYLLAAPITFENLFEIDPDINLEYLRAVGFSGMNTPPELRAELENRGIMVLEHYTAFEFMGIATECPMHKGLHVQYPYYIEKDEDDNVIISDLGIRASPLLRYNLQDYLAEFDTSECDCGRTSPRISIGGRALDRVVIDGKVFYPSTVVFAVKDVIQKEKIKIDEWQLVQYENRNFLFKVVGAEDVTSILNKLQELFGEVEIEVERVDQIPTGQIGKKYWILNKTATATETTEAR